MDFFAAVQDETPAMFERRAFKAELEGLVAIEASNDILAHYNPDGLGNAKFFNFGKKLRVYEVGAKKTEDEKEKLQHHQRMHGETSYFEGRT